ncbi:MAG TPA: methyltransferase dimerization domain-containing protein, partial [Acidimicrobiia bacterium]|nr:methyltransferase dimerization domain-containing protein [Acidimicrobiia bacterium]
MEATPDPDDVLELFLGFWISRTVMAAVELGVFEVLGAEQAGDAGLTLDEAQAALGLAARPARALLDTCVATGLLSKEDGRYLNTLLAARYLNSRSTHSLR